MIINILFIFFRDSLSIKNGGINYIKNKFNSQSNFYYDIKKSIFESIPDDTSEISFLGSSINEMCNWNEFFGKVNIKNIKNIGISGDVVKAVIERLDDVESSNPKKIFLMIGINDLGKEISVYQILIDYENQVILILKKTSKTQFYLHCFNDKKSYYNV